MMDVVKAKITELLSLKPSFSNYFNQPVEQGDECVVGAQTVVVVKKTHYNYKRIYLLSCNETEAISLLKQLAGFCVFNLPSKGDIVAFEAMLNKAGFVKERTYERLFNTKIVGRSNIKEIKYASIDQVDQIYDLFHNYFVAYVDYLPSKDELRELIEQKQILINTNQESVAGAFILEVKGQKGYLRAWIDHGENGMKLLLDAYTLLSEQEVKYAYMWADTQNEKVLKIHKLLGAQPDGLKDYTFVKK